MSEVVPIRVLFVCLGNICRSPLAESIFRHLVRERGVEDRFVIDSAGTSNFHQGAAPDARTVATARDRGVVVEGQSRPVGPDDLYEQDYVIVMDGENHARVDALMDAGGGTARIHRLREWDPTPDHSDVPDPYYGGDRGFQDVHDIVERSCAALLDHLLETEAAGA